MSTRTLSHVHDLFPDSVMTLIEYIENPSIMARLCTMDQAARRIVEIIDDTECMCDYYRECECCESNAEENYLCSGDGFRWTPGTEILRFNNEQPWIVSAAETKHAETVGAVQ